MTKSNIFLCLFIWGILCPQLYAQNLPEDPFVRYYPPKESGSGPQNFSIQTDSRGIIFIANNRGMFQYDGNHWAKHVLPNSTIVRSFGMDTRNGRLYVGGQGIVGYFETSPLTKSLIFRDLTVNLKKEKDREFDDVWKVLFLGDTVVFNTSKKLLFFPPSSEPFTILPLDYFEFAFTVGNTLYAQEPSSGLYQFHDGKMKLVYGEQKFRGSIPAIFSLEKGKLLIATETSVLQQTGVKQINAWGTADAQSFFKNNLISFGLHLQDGSIAIGTSKGGVLILDSDGKPLERYNTFSGFPNAYIRCLYEDKNENLWLGLDNGLAYVERKSPFRIPRLSGKNAGFSIYEDPKNLYLGMANRLFFYDLSQPFSPFENNTFTEIDIPQRESWKLDTIDGLLFLGHHQGAYQLKKGVALLTQGTKEDGIWNFFKHPQFPKKIFSGCYSGFLIFEKDFAGKLHLVTKLKDTLFSESCRLVEIDPTDGSLWVSHIYKGLFRLWLKPDLSGFQKKEHYFKNDTLLNVFKIDGAIVVSKKNGHFSFDRKTGEFTPYTLFNNLIKIQRLQSYTEENAETKWCVIGGKIERITKRPGKTNEYDTPLWLNRIQGDLVDNFETVFPTQKNIWLGVNDGFIKFDRTNPVLVPPASCLIRNIEILGGTDSTMAKTIWYGNNLSNSTEDSLPNFNFKSSENNLRFTIAALGYGSEEKYRYQFTLYSASGKVLTSSGWSITPQIEFTNLGGGQYLLVAAAKDAYGQVAKTNVRFYINRTLPFWVWVALFSVLFALLYGLFQRKKRKEVEIEMGNKSETIENQNEHIENLENAILTSHENFPDWVTVLGKKYHLGKSHLLVIPFIEAGLKNQEIYKAVVASIQENSVAIKIFKEHRIRRMKTEIVEKIKKKEKNPNLIETAGDLPSFLQRYKFDYEQNLRR